MRLTAEKIRGEVTNLNIRPEANGPDDWKPAIDIAIKFELDEADSIAYLITLGFDVKESEKGNAERLIKSILSEKLKAGLPNIEFIDHKINFRNGDSRHTMNPMRLSKFGFEVAKDGDHIIWAMKLDSRIDVETDLPYLAQTLKRYISFKVTPPPDLVTAMQENSEQESEQESEEDEENS